MLELRQLKELLTIARCGTVSEAAKQLNLSQPALSRSLQRLEEELQAKLFTHGKNKIALTATGEQALGYAQQILDLSEIMVTTVRRYQAEQNYISIRSCAPAPLWELTAQCSMLYPELTQVVAVSEDESALLEAVRSGEVDCVVLTAPPAGMTGEAGKMMVTPALTVTPSADNTVAITKAAQADAELICLPFLREQLYFALHRSHKLAQHAALSFADLNGESFLLRPQIGFWSRIVKTYMPQSQFMMQQSDAAFNRIVADSSLLSFTSDIVLKREGVRTDRICVPITDAVSQVTYYAMIRQKNSPKMQLLINVLRRKAELLAQSVLQPAANILT